jgi:anti-anti-sigma regulatory factor
MLRISLEHESELATLKLEGRITGPWVDELEHTWNDIRETGLERPVVVDLSEVSFVDSEGQELLRWMFTQGAELRSGPLVSVTRLILNRIKGDSNEKHATPIGG